VTGPLQDAARGREGAAQGQAGLRFPFPRPSALDDSAGNAHPGCLPTCTTTAGCRLLISTAGSPDLVTTVTPAEEVHLF